MKFNKLAVALLIVSVFASACKKDPESESSKKYLSGTLSIGEIPSYIKSGSSWILKIDSDLSLKDGDESMSIVYKWSVTGGSIKDSTAMGITFVASDEPGNASIVCSTSVEGYSTRSVSLSSKIVNKSSIDIDWTTEETVVNGKTWKRFNLADVSICGNPYQKQEALLDLFGAFYSGKDVACHTICPSGYHVPSLAEFESLFDGGTDAGMLMAANPSFNGAVLWKHYADDVFTLSNSTGFTALPFGHAMIMNDSWYFYGFGEYATFWALDGSDPVACQIFADEPKPLFYRPEEPADFAAPLRCVKD